MEKRHSGPSHGASLTAPLRDLLHVGNSKESIAPELKEALQLLQLKNLDALENHFLATDAFLKPWSQFRDNWLLLQTQASSHASPPGQLQATGILWFYTSFLEGELRYDARCDDSTSVFTTDETKYGTFDDQHWGVEEYEKMMYAWLLQEFRVGKARNPFGFKYFEYRNVIAAWKNVFVPVINAVRDSYDVKGRRHYGRLATFIEDRYPSRLAFPEGNVAAPMNGAPYRMVSVSRAHGARPWPGSSPQLIPRTNRPITKKEYAEFEQELRVVYPKYGQVVERPKFTTRMEDWLAAQKVRAQQKRRAKELNGKKPLILQRRGGRESPMFGCKGVEVEEEGKTKAAAPKGLTPRRSSSPNAFSSTPRSSRSLKLPPGTLTGGIPHPMYGYVDVPIASKENKDSWKNRPYSNESCLNAATSQVPDYTGTRRSAEYKSSHQPLAPPPAAWKPNMDRMDSEGVYSSIRNSNPFTENGPTFLGQSCKLEGRASWESERSLMAQKSAIPKPLFDKKSSAREPNRGSLEGSSFVRALNEAKARVPSYEGHDYERNIAPSFMERKTHVTAKLRADNEIRPGQSSLPPEPVHPVNEKGVAYHIPQALPWPGQSPQFPPPSTTAWPDGSDGEHIPPPPPIPAKNPQRYNSVHDLQSAESSRRTSLQPPVYPTLGPRIISVENIRAHLTVSPQTSHEDLKKVDESREVKALPPVPLRTYNSHMFPRQERKGTPLSGSDTARYDVGGEYELEVLGHRERK